MAKIVKVKVTHTFGTSRRHTAELIGKWTAILLPTGKAVKPGTEKK